MPNLNTAKTQHMNNALYKVIKRFVMMVRIISSLKSSGLKS